MRVLDGVDMDEWANEKGGAIEWVARWHRSVHVSSLLLQ